MRISGGWGMKIKVIVRSHLPPAVRIGKVGSKEITLEEKKGRREGNPATCGNVTNLETARYAKC